MNSLMAVIRDSSTTNGIEDVCNSLIGDRAPGAPHFDLIAIRIDFLYTSGTKRCGIKKRGFKNDFRRSIELLSSKKILLDNKTSWS